MNRNTIACAAVVGAGVGLCFTAGSYYMIYKIHRMLQKELANITHIVTDIKKDISDLKTSNKRKGLAAGSSFSDETSDVYYDFSDEGDEDMIEVAEDDISESFSSEEYDDDGQNGNDLIVYNSSDSSLINATELNNSNNKTNSYSNNLRKSDKKFSFKKRLDVFDDILERLLKKPDNYLMLYKKILSYHNKYINKCEYLWRLAKACHTCGLIAGENGDAEGKKEYMYNALKYAKNALALTDDNANVHKWYAICIGSCSEYETIQNKIKYGYIFKEHAQLALQLDSTDESLYYLMGRWCYEVAMMPWIERKVANALFGTVPTATFQEARNYFLTAENLHCTKGVWKENLLYLAKTYIEEKQYEQAIKWLDKAAKDESSKPEDPAIIKEINDLQNKFAAYRLENALST